MKKTKNREIRSQAQKKTAKDDYSATPVKKRIFLSSIIVFIIPVLLYIQTVSFSYTYFDDDDILLNNLSFLSDFHNAPKAFLTDAFIGKSSSFYRPMQTLSYMIDIQIAGGNHAWMYHLTNVLLLGFIAVVLFLLLKKFSIPPRLAMLGTLIYCAHPLFVSTIAWIPARGDLQLTLFSLFSIFFFIEYLQSKKNIHLILHWISFTVALLCKETTMFLPFLFILYYFLFQAERKFEKRFLLILFLYAISGALLYWLRLQAIGAFSNKNDDVGLLPALLNLQTIPESLAMFFIPYKIAPFPSYSIFKTITGAAVIIALVILFVKNKEKKDRQKIFGMLWFVLLLLPTMIYKNPHIDYLNHRFSLPLIGILIFLLYIFPKKWFEKGDIKRAWVLVLLIAILSSFTFIKARTYTDPMTFYNKSIELNPYSDLAHYNRGCIEKEKKGKLQDAIDDFSQAIELNPKYTKAYNNRGFAYGSLGLSEKAVSDYTKAIELKPDYPDAYSNRGSEYYKQNLFDKAIEDFSKAIELKPEFAVTYYNRGKAYASQQSYDKAILDYTKAIELDSAYPDAFYNRGNIYCTQKSYTDAINDYTKAIQLKPDNANAYFNRGAAYNASGLYDNAIADFTKVLEYDPNDASSYFSRGNAYHSNGMNDKACSDYKKSEELGLKDAKEKIETCCK